MEQLKLKTIKFNNGVVMRMLEAKAEEYISKGEAIPASKKSLRKFWKLHDKIKENNEYLASFDFSKDQDKNVLHKEEDGKTFAYLFRRNLQKVEAIVPEQKGKEKLPWYKRLSNYLGLSHFEAQEIILEEGKAKMIIYPRYQKFLVGVS